MSQSLLSNIVDIQLSRGIFPQNKGFIDYAPFSITPVLNTTIIASIRCKSPTNKLLISSYVVALDNLSVSALVARLVASKLDKASREVISFIETILTSKKGSLQIVGRIKKPGIEISRSKALGIHKVTRESAYKLSTSVVASKSKKHTTYFDYVVIEGQGIVTKYLTYVTTKSLVLKDESNNIKGCSSSSTKTNFLLRK